MGKMSYPEEVQLFIAEVVFKIKKAIKPDFILIAGSFGKRSWLYSEGELTSDFEFIFIKKRAWSLKKKKTLQTALNNKYLYDISLKGYLLNKVKRKIVSNYSNRNPGYISLDFFDTFYNPTILFSKNKEALEVNVVIDDVPDWEAWR